LLTELDEKNNMDVQTPPIRICVPDITLKKLSFCDGSVSGFEIWAKKLPMANVGVAAKMLFQATRELNSAPVPANSRYKMLEIIRTQTYIICDALGKRFLKQSVTLTDNDLKVVSLAQTLQNQLASGYKRIIIDELAQPIKKNEAKLLTFAIHRAISDLTQTILRALQLYSKPPKNAWLELHQMFALAQAKGIFGYQVKDNRAKYVASSTILDVYIRALLLGCCKPNQLRQIDLANLYAATELWSGAVKVCSSSDVKALFLYSQHKDSAPVYRALLKTSTNANQALSPTDLVNALQKHLDKEASGITIPGNITEAVIHHLIHAWGAMVERSFRRTADSGEIQIGIGLLASHYFSANELSLPFLLHQWNAEPSKDKAPSQPSDVWDKSFDAGNQFVGEPDNIEFDSIAFISSNEESTEDTGPKGKQLKAIIFNTSPGGYGIALDNPPNSVQTGELLVIKEGRMTNWSLGCIRWIRTQRNQPTQLGIELLAPKVESVAVKMLNKTGENGEYLRGISIPALPAAGQEESLILPTIPFKVGCKAQLLNDKHGQRIQLLKRINTSRSFVQYTFQSLTQVLNSSTSKDDAGDEFASIWDKL
jgi:hypothetical protein